MRLSFSITLILISLFLNAQSKADKLLAENRFLEAIEQYKKDIKKSPSAELFINLGSVYTKINKYSDAEDALSKAVELKPDLPEAHLLYGKAMLNNNKPAQAKEHFNTYKELLPENPKADHYLVSIDSIIKWNNADPSWEITDISGINTSKDEFGAHPYLNGLIFTTNGNTDWVEYTEYQGLNENYYDIYYALQAGKSTFTKPELFTPKLMSDYHDGPVAITPDSSKIYFTKTKKYLKSERMHLYYSEIKDGEIQTPEAFDYNNNEYSIMHPTFSDDGNILFFASDKNGSVGGYDIFYCKKTRRYGWSAPRPVPGAVNTVGNEVFPFYKDGNLYFSSDGHFGFGGLDLFVAFDQEQYKVVKNLKAPINSNFDDFSFYTRDGETGYFSSNRDGGKGGDDIYQFKKLEVIKKDEFPTLTGLFEYQELAQAGVELILLNEEGVEIGRTTTNEFGEFEFRNLDPSQDYTIKSLAELEDGDLYITNANGEKLVLMEFKDGGEFVFKPLSTEETQLLIPIEEEYPAFLTIPISGFVYKELKGDLNNRLEVLIYDDNGTLLARTYTDKDGKFKFTNLTPDALYEIKVATTDEVFLELNNAKGEKYEDIEKVSASTFTFRRLDPDESTFKLISEENVVMELKQNEKFNLPSIYYASNSAKINAESAESLDMLFIILKKNPHTKVIFESHTDTKGKDSYNLKLSEKRAEAAVKYLIDKGIEKEMVEAKGYGETRTLISDSEISKLSTEVEKDAAHAQNRRTEISIKGKSIKF